MTDLGPLNRRGVLFANNPTAGDGGAPVDALTPLRNLPLTVEDNESGKDQVIGDRVSENADIIWRTRWFDGLAVDMFMTFEGSTYRIMQKKEIGRRGGWRIWGNLVR